MTIKALVTLAVWIVLGLIVFLGVLNNQNIDLMIRAACLQAWGLIAFGIIIYFLWPSRK